MWLHRYSGTKHPCVAALAVLFAVIGAALLMSHTAHTQNLSDYNEGKNLSSYTVTRTTGRITLDGVLDEADWKRAEEVSFVNARNGGEIPLRTTMRLLWDDAYLYIAFYCEDPDAWATFTEEDDPMWTEEVVEFFIDPDCNGYNYYEHEINPINVKVDLYITNAGRRLDGRFQGWQDWDFTDIRSGVYVEGDGKNAGTDDEYWTVEAAVPFDDLWEMPKVPPDDGDMWRFNAYRIERGDPDAEDDDFYGAFSPVYRGSFHTPWQFGKIYFRK